MASKKSPEPKQGLGGVPIYHGTRIPSEAFIGAISEYPGVRISMDGRGKAPDNVYATGIGRGTGIVDMFVEMGQCYSAA